MSGRPARASVTSLSWIPRSSEPSSRPIESVAVRYPLAWRTISARIRFFPQLVSTIPSRIPRTTRRTTARPATALATPAETRPTRRLHTTGSIVTRGLRPDEDRKCGLCGPVVTLLAVLVLLAVPPDELQE